MIEREKVRILREHVTGVKRLSYSGHFGGHLVSVGHEIYVNVWAPESKISEVLMGRLRGHTKPVIDAKFLNNRPFVVTVDEANFIRIWDIRTLVCLQLLKSKSKAIPQGLAIIDNSSFWVFGRRFT